MSKTPAWAAELVARVCREEGVAEPDEFVWRRSRARPGVVGHFITMQLGSYDPRHHPGGRFWVAPRAGRARPTNSSGTTFHKPFTRICITAGSSRLDQKLVLLHEIAHHVVGGEHGHDTTFWEKAWELYGRYHIPSRYALRREEGYRKGAGRVYRAARARQEPKPTPVVAAPVRREYPYHMALVEHRHTCGQCVSALEFRDPTGMCRAGLAAAGIGLTTPRFEPCQNGTRISTCAHLERCGDVPGFGFGKLRKGA